MLAPVPIWQPAYIGLGSNLEDPVRQVRCALQRLAQLPRTHLVLASPLYRSSPMGPIAQPDFVNAVAGVLTRCEPAVLLAGLRELESAFGRPSVRERWGPRVLDLDLLLYGRLQLHDPQLTLPHPGVVQRNFVLYPLADIAPELEVPGVGRVHELKRRVSAEGIQRLP